MGRLVYGQYDSNKYPLKRYSANDIPKEIIDVIQEISSKGLGIVRGGLAFIFILNKNDYILKDLDMVACTKDSDLIKSITDKADEVYVNKNSFGDTVITAFWKDANVYYKLDILLCNEIPPHERHEWNHVSWNTITASYLWMNRICKIAEKNQRKHSDEKTINHFKVADSVADYLMKNRRFLEKENVDIVEAKLTEVELVLNDIVSKVELKAFLDKQKSLIV